MGGKEGQGLRMFPGGENQKGKKKEMAPEKTQKSPGGESSPRNARDITKRSNHRKTKRRAKSKRTVHTD